MKIENEFTVSVPVERAWEVLTDIEGIAPCMPGAQLTGVEGDTYSGKLRVKVGPVISEFAGTVSFVTLDEAERRAVIDAKGRDSRGAGNASATIAASLRPDGDRTVVSVDTDLRISGKLAQFGNRMIAQVSEKLLGQFVDCLESKLAVDVPATAVGEQAATPHAVVEGAQQPSGAAAAAAASGQPPEQPPTVEPEQVVEPEHAAQATPKLRSVEPVAEAEPVDLVRLAGGTVTRRLVPVLVGVVVIAAVVWYLLAR
jgi:carbon monoxide dehydrogenase subunit G